MIEIKKTKANLLDVSGGKDISRKISSFNIRSNKTINSFILLRLKGILDLENDPGAFKDKDLPDVDLDFVPDAKDDIRDYAAAKYGADKVCSVGLWQTYKPRSSLKDVAKSLGYKDKLDIIEKMTKELPDEFDDANLEEALSDYPDFKEWYDQDDDNRKITKYAFKLVGKIKTQGKHAGGLIIANVPLEKYLPIAKIGSKGKEKWTSEWTEGKNVQLSKFGFVKYDILGLKTIQYIHEASKMIKRNHGIEINWDEIGYDDVESFKTANELKTDSIFQFDTDVAKSILSKGGVKRLTDILVYTSLGRPGPMPMVDEYILRRDSEDPHSNNEMAKGYDWRSTEHPKVLALLEDTLAICTYQEQVSLLLTELAGFTLPEAEKARKIMSKKWKDQMVWVREKILKGMANSLDDLPCYLPRPQIDPNDEEKIMSAKEVDEICGNREWTWSKEYWKRLETFARYSFNKCLDADTLLENPETGETITIEKLYNSPKKFNLLSHQNGIFISDEVIDIHYNGEQPIYEIEFNGGIKQYVTIDHRFMNEFGHMKTIYDIVDSNQSIKHMGGIDRIKNIKYVGVRPTYSPEMKSESHNYLTKPECGQPIHANSHAVSYSIQCYRCLYLKTHYPSEWWSSVLNTCNRKKQPKYIQIAKSEGAKFGSLDVNKLSIKFDVVDGRIVPGLLGIRGIGVKMTDRIDVNINDIKSIDDFVARQINNKLFMERIILLGAFDKIHKNRKAIWYWYLYRYGTTDVAKQLREKIHQDFAYTPEQIEEMREKLYLEHKAKHPKSRVIPKRILNHNPKPNPSIEDIIEYVGDDYSYEETLMHQKEFLDYHWDSPMEMYGYKGGHGIEEAKENGILECVISSVDNRRTNNGKKFMTLTVTDGTDHARIQIWSDIVEECGPDFFKPGDGIAMRVSYNEKYKSFNPTKDYPIVHLPKKNEWEKFQEYIEDTQVFPKVDIEDDFLEGFA